MSHYRISITKIEDNPNYEEELKRYQEETKYRNFGYSDRYPEPNKTVEMNALHTIVNEEQFEAIRKATLEKF